MIGKTHLAGGLATAAGACLLAKPALGTGMIWLVGCAFGSLLPDIDHKGSTLGQKMKPVSAVVGVVAGHRNFFHWFLPYLVLAVILHFTAPQADKITFAVLLGVLSHLFLDALNPSGVPLLPGHRIHLLRIHTGSGVDKAIGGLLYLFACIGLAIWIFRMI